jgi:hypothetical protein
MHKIGMGYSKYFNHKYKRSGVLFQGPFQAVLIKSNAHLLHTSVYVTLNDRVHSLGHGVSKSSWNEYVGNIGNKSKNGVFCEKGIILGQFGNSAEYKKFAEESLEWIRENKELEKLLLE